MWTYNYTSELYHYGRMGMKWGQHIFGKVQARRAARKKAANLKKAREAKAEKQRLAAERANAVDKGKIRTKDMTDAEINRRIARLKLEKDYNDLVQQTREFERGSRLVNKFLDTTVDKLAENVSADTLSQVIKTLAVKGANAGLNKALKTDGEEYVFTNNKKK